MEAKFQTSFIPKKPLTGGSASTSTFGVSPARPKKTGSLFLNLAILLFVISLGAGGASYAWEKVSASNQDNYKQQLADRQKQFNPNLIGQLKQTNSRIDLAKSMLDKHVALSNIFDIVSRLAVESVRFTSMDVTATPATPGSGGASAVKITITGYGVNLPTIAFQAKVLGELEKYGLHNIVMNPVVSEPTLGLTGVTTFGLVADVNPDTLVYMKSASTATTTNSQ